MSYLTHFYATFFLLNKFILRKCSSLVYSAHWPILSSHFLKKIILLEFHTAFEPEGHQWSTALVEAELQVASIKECPALSQSSNIAVNRLIPPPITSSARHHHRNCLRTFTLQSRERLMQIRLAFQNQ